MDINLIVSLTGIMLFCYWFNYAIGNPLAPFEHVDSRAILFWLPLYLVERRLKEVDRYHDFVESLTDQLAVTEDPLVRTDLYLEARTNRMVKGRSLFTWERALLCPVCLHFWLTVIFVAACLLLNQLHARECLPLAAFTYLVNHFFIRKI